MSSDDPTPEAARPDGSGDSTPVDEAGPTSAAVQPSNKLSLAISSAAKWRSKLKTGPAPTKLQRHRALVSTQDAIERRFDTGVFDDESPKPQDYEVAAVVGQQAKQEGNRLVAMAHGDRDDHEILHNVREQAIDEEARRGAEEFEKEIKDTAAAMRKQLVTKAIEDLVRDKYFGDRDLKEEGLPISFQVHLRLLFIPGSTKKRYWDLFIVLLVLWNCGMIPVEIAFEEFLQGRTDTLNAVIDVMFFFDIVANFRTAYPNPKGELELRWDHICRKYGTSTWFYIDVVSTLPWEVLFFPLNTPQYRTIFKLLSCVKMIRLLRLSKFFRWLNKVLGKYANAVTLFRLFFLFVLAGHWVGCIVYFIEMQIISSNGNPSFGVCEPAEGCFIDIYANAITMGIGSLVANTGYTPNEATELFLIVAICIGIALDGVIFGNMIGIISGEHSVVAQFQITNDNLNDACMYMQLPQDLQFRIFERQEHMSSRATAYLEGVDLPSLSPALQSAVRKVQFDEMVTKLSFFGQNMPPSLAAEVTLVLEPHYYSSTDLVCTEGKLGDTMFFLTSGMVELKSENIGEDLAMRRTEKEVYKNSHVWGAEVLAEIIKINPNEPAGVDAIWEGRYLSTTVCVSCCELWHLDCEKVRELIASSSKPRLLKRMLFKAYVRQKIGKQMSGGFDSGNFFIRPIFEAWQRWAGGHYGNIFGQEYTENSDADDDPNDNTVNPWSKKNTTAKLEARQIDVLKRATTRALEADDFRKAKLKIARLEKLDRNAGGSTAQIRQLKKLALHAIDADDYAKANEEISALEELCATSEKASGGGYTSAAFGLADDWFGDESDEDQGSPIGSPVGATTAAAEAKLLSDESALEDRLDELHCSVESYISQQSNKLAQVLDLLQASHLCDVEKSDRFDMHLAG